MSFQGVLQFQCPCGCQRRIEMLLHWIEYKVLKEDLHDIRVRASQKLQAECSIYMATIDEPELIYGPDFFLNAWRAEFGKATAPQPCPHQYINVGFTSLKLVCKFCDQPKPEGQR